MPFSPFPFRRIRFAPSGGLPPADVARARNPDAVLEPCRSQHCYFTIVSRQRSRGDLHSAKAVPGAVLRKQWKYPRAADCILYVPLRHLMK